MTKLQQLKGSQTCDILETSTIYTVIWAKLSFYTCKMTEVNLFSFFFSFLYVLEENSFF